MKQDKGIAIIAMVASLILVTGTAAAQTTTGNETAGADIDGSVNDLGDFNETEGGDVTTDPGSIYSANVTAQQSTRNWAGLYGNATGNLVLGDDNDEQLYNWEATAEYVFATTSGSPDFTSLSSASIDNVEGNFSTNNGADNISNTLSTGFDISPTNGVSDSLNTVGVNSLDNDGNSVWETAVLSANSDLIFTAVVNEGQTAYNGDTADYQAMVPTADGTSSGSTQTYNLYMELQ